MMIGVQRVLALGAICVAISNLVRSEVAPTPQHIKLTRRDHRRTMVLHSLGENRSSLATEVVHRRVQLDPTPSALYTTQITLGSPAQKFDVVLDTGSDELWLPSLKCESPACIGKRMFNSKKSSSYRGGKTMSYMTFATGEIFGYYAREKLTFGGLVLDRFKFTEAATMSFDLRSLQADGILGLGTGMNELSLTKQLREQKLVSEFAYSFILDDGEHKSEMIFGVDVNKYQGELVYAPLTDPQSWTIAVDSIEIVNSSFMCQPNYGALIDTGATIISGPSEDISKLNKALGADWSAEHKQFMFSDCSLALKPTVTIRIQGAEFRIEPTRYVKRLDPEPDACSSVFRAMSPDHWVLGLPFLEQLYSVFDYEQMRVGFARAVRSPVQQQTRSASTIQILDTQTR